MEKSAADSNNQNIIKVRIKWAKKVFEDFEINLNENITTFKWQIQALTNIPMDKAKVLVKGKVLNDGAEWSAYPAVKDGATLLLMGCPAIEHEQLDVKTLKGKARKNAEAKLEERKAEIDPPTTTDISDLKNLKLSTKF